MIDNTVRAGASRPVHASRALMAPGATHLPRAKLWLAAGDALCVAAAMIGSLVLQLGHSAGLVHARAHALGLVATWVAFPVAFWTSGLYENGRVLRPRAALAPAAVTVVVAALLAATLGERWLPDGEEVAVVATFAVALLSAMLLGRFTSAEATRRGLLGARFLLVGNGEDAEKVLRLLDENPHAGMTLVGRVKGAAVPRLAIANDRCPLLGTLDHLDRIVAAHQVDGVVVAADIDGPELLRRLRSYRYAGLAVLDFVELHEQLAREIPIDEIDDAWLFLAATTGSRVHARHLKRLTDLVGAALLLVPAGIILAITAIAVRATSRGPFIFRQERVGLGGAPFQVLKVRTMYEDAEKLSGPVWSTDRDPRITPVGRVLRKFRIDELPQLVNVLRGEMSLVGPRPERPVFVEKLSRAIPYYDERHLVRPGITGWAQVMAPYAASVDDSRRKLQFDLYYAKHLSFGLDLLILAKTAKTMLFGRERCQGGMTAGHQLDAKRSR